MAPITVDGLLDHLPAAIRNRLRSARSNDVRETLASFYKTDPQENAETSPPEGERIDLCCAWGVEFYTPAHLADLVKGFRKLGWDGDDPNGPSRDPVAWLNGLRRYQHGGAWMNLGYLTSENSDLPFWGVDKHEALLPACAKYAKAGIYSMSPSLVSVVVCFVFNDETSNLLDAALRTNRKTYATSSLGWHRFNTPRIQKEEHIRQIRADITNQIGNWFSENLPGIFSSGLLDHEIPTCEFVTLGEAEPFPSPKDGQYDYQSYLEILGLRREFDVWESSGLPGLKLKMPNRVGLYPQYHLLLAINESQQKKGMPSYYSSDSRESRIAAVDRPISNLLSFWSIRPMLEGYTQHLSEVRDLAILSPKGSHSSAEILEGVRGDVAFSVDIAAVTSELAMNLEDRVPMVSEIERFEPSDSEFYEPGTLLSQHLEFVVGRQATWLQRTDESLRNQLAQYGSLVGAEENVRLQGKITFLTWVLLLLAGATLVASILGFCMRDGTPL